ncbi:Beta-1,3-galactosyltransferase 2 [Channa argus]|uniref:Hexosyltransferase n=1 Tax=Channa argus TaxID=215402 RepID=A0A6G1PTL3_CHAAH|nr:Beta-1,3-galactosyltransferase 2 [Channa argus]
MMENPVSKSEKPPWARCRRWLCLLMLFLMVGIFFTVYNSSIELSWDFTFFMSRQSFNNMTAAIGPISAVDDSASQYFVAYPHEYRFIIDEPNRCRQERPFLILMVPVAPQNIEAREVIRNTWGKDTTVMGKVVSHYFLLGLSAEGQKTEEEQVLKESQRHHDILQSNFLDSYNNLTIKTMVMFEWLVSHCPNTYFAMKIDSDMFLNVPNLVDMVLKAPTHLYMTGMLTWHAPVLRDPSSKWFLPVSAFPESTYPTYAMGLGYAFSLDLAKKILEASLHVRAVYIEDVYVGLCMRYLGIRLTDPPHGGLFRTTIPLVKGSCYWTSVITTILRDSNQLKDVWQTYKSEAQSGC